MTENYFPSYAHMPLESRQEWLLYHYKFQCGCHACEHKYPILDKLPQALSCRNGSLILRCSKCSQGSMNPSASSGHLVVGTCGTCGGQTDSAEIGQVEARLAQLMQDFGNAKNSLMNLDASKNVDDEVALIYKKALDIHSCLCDLINPPHRVLYDVEQWLTSVFLRIKGNWKYVEASTPASKLAPKSVSK